MIRRLNCPGCNRVLRLDDSLNLKAGQCPACGQKFRIPWAAPETAPPKPRAVAAPPARKEAASQAPRPAPPPKPVNPFAEDDAGPSAYQIHLDGAPQPAAAGHLIE